MIRHVLALLLATLAVACATPREPPPPPMANNNDRCEDLATRIETEERARERLIAALLACRLDPAIDAAEAERVVGQSLAAIDVRGDNAIFVARSSASEVMMTGTLTAPMKRITKTDLWVARFRFHAIDYAMLKFLPIASGQQLPGTKPITWRGPNAPEHPAEKRDLKGKIVKRTLWSDALQETRKIDVYLPPSYRLDVSYPTLYMGDGEFLAGWARYIEPMIDKGTIPAIIIVGAWSGQAGIVENRSSLGVELRAADYLPGFKNAGDRFDRHMRFFTQELVPYAEKEFALARDRSKRALQGQSNSAVFAREAALMHGELFSTALAFSGGWKLSERFGPSDAPRARFIMGAGLYEGGFSVGTQVAARTLREKGFNVLEEYLFAGHDPDAWAFLLVKYLPRAFPIVSDTAQSTPALPRYDRVLLLEQTSETSANVSIGDLNKDGNLDIVLAKGRHWPLIDRVLLGDGRGGIASAYNLGVASDRSYSGRLADLDGDGDLDVVLSNDAPDPKRIYLNDGTGRFREGSAFGRPEWPTRNAAVADMNGDGRPDIVVANRAGGKGANHICLNKGNAQSADCIAFSTESATTVTAADMNRDGLIDLLVPHRDGGQSYVYINAGNANFPVKARVPFGPASAKIRMAEAADLDRDGLQDIVAIDETTGVTAYFGRSGGTYSPGLLIAEATPAPYALAIADLNADRSMEVIVGHVKAPSTIYINDGSGRRYTLHRFGDSKGTVYGFAVADLDNDGLPDIAAARSEAPNVVYFADR